MNKQSNEIILNLIKSKVDKENQLFEINETVRNNQFFITSIEKNINFVKGEVNYEDILENSKAVQVENLQDFYSKNEEIENSPKKVINFFFNFI